MKIMISGYFDAGYSIGIDDYPFEKEGALNYLNSRSGFVASYHKPRELFAFADETGGGIFHVDDAEGHIGLSVLVGVGLKIDLSESVFMKMLHSEAIEAASDKRFMGSYYTDHPQNIVDIITDFQHKSGFSKATVNLYGLGIGYVFIESAELDDELAPFALWIYRCYEYASYGAYSSGAFRNAFSKMVAETYSIFSNKDGYEILTRRKIPCDFFPGYQLILLCNNQQETLLGSQILKNYDELTPLQMDDGRISLGWAAAIVEPSNTDYVSRILFLLKMAQVYYGICDGFERLFSHHIASSVRENLSGEDSVYDVVSLNRLRTIAHTVAEFTRFGALSQNISDQKLLNSFDQMGGLSQKIEHLASACEIFTNIQNEVLEHKQARRDKRLNVYAMALTVLTLVSVLADMLSINAALMLGGWTMLLKLSAILGLVILVIYLAFEGRFVRRKSKKS